MKPIVSIGMPVRNGAGTVQAAIDSLRAQTYPHFRLLISDNASTDATERICRAAASLDSRIVYVRQESNIGAEGNFDFVLTKADTEYFMWAAADDTRSPDYLALTVEFLEGNKDFIGATCPVRFEDGEFDTSWMGDGSCEEPNPYDRILAFFETWHANGRLYSLWRTAALHDVVLTRWPYLGGDWTFITNLLNRGKFKRLESGSLVLGRKGISNRRDIFARYRNRKLLWVIPSYDLSRDALKLFKGAGLEQRAKLWGRLLRLNKDAFKLQIKYALKS